MKIVIDIDDSEYKEIVEDRNINYLRIIKAIKNGTPLPKGCGRLIDADELKKDYPHDTDWDYPVNTNRYVVESIDNAKTIIGVDKEDEE